MLSLPVSAQQNATSVQCGTILEAELSLTDIVNNDYSFHTYTIRLDAGDTVTVTVQRIGEFLDFGVNIYGLQDNRLKYVDQRNGIVQMDATVPASGTYSIHVYSRGSTDVGAYEAFFGCTLRDGTVIAPGDVLPDTHPTEPATVTTELPTNFVGFPGLAPVDMSNAMKLPLIVDTPMTGIVTPTSNDVLGFSVEVNTGDTLDLNFNRVSGNLNLGVVVLSPDSKVVFYGGLILSDSLSTSLIVQKTGEYTIGVYRVDLLPPDTSDATVFQVQGTVAP